MNLNPLYTITAKGLRHISYSEDIYFKEFLTFFTGGPKRWKDMMMSFVDSVDNPGCDESVQQMHKNIITNWHMFLTNAIGNGYITESS